MPRVLARHAGTWAGERGRIWASCVRMRGQVDAARGIAGCVVAFTLGCATSSMSTREPSLRRENGSAGAELRVLGTAQDGGVPHAACTCDRCEAARREPARARDVVALALVTSDGVRLVDATPDLPEQLHALADVRRPMRGAVDRTPIDGIFLTHTLGFRFVGPRATVLYIPDTEPWARWSTSTIEDELRDVDVALLDGSFYSAGELPGRPVSTSAIR